ncbi:MAG TPA: peptide chain release factor-like protein [Nitrospiria bacterium]|nr:peptide chain release factor-like protein [Nitrospiria bacterium]
MPSFPVTSAKHKQLAEKMARLGIHEEDIDETFTRSTGAGGQHVNKTSTCVVLVHRPSGTTVRCQKARSQALNRFLARRNLVERIEELRLGKLSAEKKRVEKIRRQKRRRSKRAKQKMLEDKKRVGKKKSLRKKVHSGGSKED